MWRRDDIEHYTRLAVLAASASEAKELLENEPDLPLGAQMEAHRRLKRFAAAARAAR